MKKNQPAQSEELKKIDLNTPPKDRNDEIVIPEKKKKNLFASIKEKCCFKSSSKGKASKAKKIFLIAGLGILIVILVLGLGIGLPALAVFKEAKVVETKARDLKDSLASKDLTVMKEKMSDLEKEIEALEKKYKGMTLAKIVPGVNGYYSDGLEVMKAAKAGIKAGNIVVEAIEPYQDFLGLKGATESAVLQGGAQTTEERIGFLVESISGLKPRLDDIEKEVETIKTSVGKIDPNRYPEEVKGIEIRNKISQVKNLVADASKFVQQGRPLIEKADWLLGKEEPRNYLFLFQNDGELRPTGGFWTAYGIIKVDNGKFSPAISQDIYALDAKFDSTIPAPRPIEEYHKNVYYLYLRDMNLSPDFKESVEEFAKYYNQISGTVEFDGVIAVDTQVLVSLLEVLGRVGVPGWGNFEPDPDERCWGCPQVVYQLEMLADKPKSAMDANRKGFLAPLMHSILANTLGSPKETVAKLATALMEDLNEKHMLVYFPDEELQKAVEGIGIAGRIESFDGDYFQLTDTNFAGAKSNLFISQEIEQDIKIEKGKIVKKVTVKYTNSAPASNCNLEKGDLCLNGLYRDWFRFYVPQGSKLIKMTGSEVEPVVYEELGKTVFEGFYGNKYPLYPEGNTRVTIEYELPFDPGKSMDLLIQKQPGTKSPQYTIKVNGKEKESFELKSDKTVSISF